MTGAPDWLVPGAKVVVYTLGNITHRENPKTTTIAKVATKTFTVADKCEPRFKIDTQESARQGGSWGRTRVVIPWSSPEAQAILSREADRRIRYRATVAVETWVKKPTRANRLAAIDALQAVVTDDREAGA